MQTSKQMPAESSYGLKPAIAATGGSCQHKMCCAARKLFGGEEAGGSGLQARCQPINRPCDDGGTRQRDEATRLYSIKCARCHKFYDPADYGDGEWHTWMNKMSRKARLKADQAQLLSRYLETFRTAQRSDGKDRTP